MATAAIRPNAHGHNYNSHGTNYKSSSKSSSSSRSSRSSSRDCNEIVEERITTSSGEVRTHRYLKTKFLGKGGFANCYVFTSLETNIQYCGKVVAKSSLTKSKAKQKLQAEIKIHKTLSHRHVVRFEHFFEDAHNVYIILELCPNYSMSELMRRRKRLTEPEAQYYMLQLLDGVDYLHKINVIHRDLKLGNLFLDRKMEVKIGDLGLAAKLSHGNERKRTICGTPNYIAPEILEGKQGHSFQVDTWSIGVILYTFLIGKPPYETNDVKSTYRRIRANMYSFPEHVQISDNAKNLIKRILQLNPENRPSIAEIVNHPFFTHSGARIPTSLPTSALTTAPLFVNAKSSSSHRNPLGEVNTNTGKSSAYGKPSKDHGLGYGRSTGAMMRGGENQKITDRMAHTAREAPKQTVTVARPATARPSSHVHADMQTQQTNTAPAENKENNANAANFNDKENAGGNQQWAKPVYKGSSTSTASTIPTSNTASDVRSSDVNANVKGGFNTPPQQKIPESVNQNVGTLENMHQQLAQSFARQSEVGSHTGAAPQPVSSDLEPRLWVTKWVDYTSKYGLGYLLSDGSSGVYFNDSSKIILATNASNFEYMERSSRRNGVRPPDPPRNAHCLEEYPAELNKKVTLLKHFRNYLVDQQTKEGGAGAVAVSDSESSVTDGMPYLKKWVRTRHAILFRLSNRTVQVNFFDHTEILLSSEARLVTYVDRQSKRTTFPLAAVVEYPRADIAKRLKYTKDILHQLISGGHR